MHAPKPKLFCSFPTALPLFQKLVQGLVPHTHQEVAKILPSQFTLQWQVKRPLITWKLSCFLLYFFHHYTCHQLTYHRLYSVSISPYPSRMWHSWSQSFSQFYSLAYLHCLEYFLVLNKIFKWKNEWISSINEEDKTAAYEMNISISLLFIFKQVILFFIESC